MQIPDVLTDEWIPPELLARGTELTEINETFRVRNVYCTGPPGVGKTLTSRIWLSQFDSATRFYACLRRNWRASLTDAFREYGRETTTRTDFAKELTEINSLHMVIDDISMLYHISNLWGFLHGLYNMSPSPQREKQKVMVISTMPWHKFSKIIPPATKSRYNFTPILFGAYSPQELFMILEQRVENAWKHWSPQAVRYVAAKIRRHGTDLRLGLRILRFSYEYCDSEKLTDESVQIGWDFEKHRFMKEEVLLKFKPFTALLLYALASILFTEKTESVSSHKLYERTQQLAHKFDAEAISSPLLNYHLQRLDEAHWVKRVSGLFGRRGGEVILDFDDPKLIVDVGEKLDWTEILR